MLKSLGPKNGGSGPPKCPIILAFLVVNNRCDKNGVHGQLTPQAPLNHSGVCPRVGVGQSPAVVVMLGVGVGQSTPLYL